MAAIEWSWNLLSAPAKSTLEQLAVFSGVFDAEAAEAVVQIDEPDEALLELAEHHLLAREEDGLRLLVAIRAFARQRLDQSTAKAGVTRRFATYYRSVALRRDHAETARWSHHIMAALPFMTAVEAFEVLGPSLMPCVGAITPTALLPHCEALTVHPDLAPAQQALAQLAVASCLVESGRASDALERIDRALASGLLDDSHTLFCHGSRARLLVHLARAEEARVAALAGLDVPPAATDVDVMSLLAIASVLDWLGERARARGLRQEILALAASSTARAMTLSHLALEAQANGELEAAEAHYQQMFSLVSDREHDPMIPRYLARYASLVHERGELERARGLYEQAAGALEEAHDIRGGAVTRAARAALEVELGNLDEAAAQLERARRILDRFGSAPHRRILETYAVAVEGDAAAIRHRLAGLGEEYAGHSARILRSRILPLRERANGLVVDELGFSLYGGDRVDLSKYRAHRRILRALVEAHGNGRRLTRDEVFAAGWPGIQIHPDSVGNRVRVALSKLRKVGLADVLQRDAQGYGLMAGLQVSWVGAD